MPRLAFHLLGSPRVELDGAPIEVDTRKATALAVYLAVTGELHSRERLATLFWPDADEAKAHAALRRTLSVLNKALDGEGLRIEREAVNLETGAAWVDVAEFHRRLADCRTHGHPPHDPCPRCVHPLSEAVTLYHDDFLAGFSLRDSPAFDDWQFFQSEGLRRELADALERLVKCHSTAGEVDAAIAHARRWLSLDPMHEPAHRWLMSLYDCAGQRAAALRQYQECARILDEELGVPPLEETTRLYEAIKENRPTTETPSPKSQIPTSRRSSGVQLPAVVQASNLQPLTSNLQPLTSNLPLIGRSAEVAALQNQYASQSADGALIVIEGEAGIGKTRLAEAFIERAQAQGATTLPARCYEGERNLAYGPFLEALQSALRQPAIAARLESLEPHWLSEAARLLPDLANLRSDLPPTPPLDSPGAQSRFFESITQILLALGNDLPTVVFLDDLHWIDEASLDLFAYLARRLRGHRLCLLGTWRDEQVPTGHRLRQALAESQRAGLAHLLSLSRLSQSAVAELVQLTMKSAPESRIAERLYHETEGLPLFLVEYLAALGGGGPEAEWPLPEGVRGLLHSRLAIIDDAGRQLLGAAAVIGRSFDFDTLQVASGRSDEETVAGLESLIARGLVHEVGGGDGALTYDFGHDKLRALVYDETSLARRRLLHRRVAEALTSRARAQTPPGPLAGQVALHYRLGGRNAEAAHYYKLAGDHARKLYANAEALSHYRSALALGHPDPTALHEAIGDLQTLAGEYGVALTSYQTAAALGSLEALAELEHKLGNVYERRGDGELAERHFEAALAAFGVDGSQGGRARVLADWSLTAHHRGQTERALDLARQALTLAEAGGDQRALAQAHNILGILASSQADLPTAQLHLERSLALAETLGDTGAQAAALNNLALAFGANEQTATAITLTERALKLCASQGDRHREAALHNNLADLLHTDGQTEAAMQHLKRAVVLFAEIGVEAGVGANTSKWQPEIWKLAEW
ncbi:MAG: AAA family ATPase [Chloroflexi bacterium]|nr:AAA family ATPase [Chloroflexota bacterium]